MNFNQFEFQKIQIGFLLNFCVAEEASEVILKLQLKYNRMKLYK